MRFRVILYFLFVSCLLSCAASLGDLRELPSSIQPEVKALFPDDKKEVLYDMSIKFLNNYNSGILVISRDTSNHREYRTVFMAKAGVKLFDFEFTDREMKINYILPQLDKKMVKKILDQDLRMLLDPIEGTPYKFRQEKKNFDLISTVKKADIYYHYFIDKKGNVSRVDRGKKNNSSVVMELSYGKDNWPDQVQINHKKIPFFIKLNEIISVK